VNPNAPISAIPLFPLDTVLFPEGVLSLRIFEPRYLDLVRDCTRDGQPFGVCLILHGDEAGAIATPSAIGTLAQIVDFDTLPDGLLGIRADGGQRFRITRSRVHDNGLAHGDVIVLPPEDVLAIPPEFLLLSTILERLLEKLGGPHADATRDRFDDAAWVGFRLAETLPLENHERQHLLELDTALERLEQLVHYLPRFQSG
jgi:Lon protease-like protein